MNKDFMLELADRIEQFEEEKPIDGLEGFNMHYFLKQGAKDWDGNWCDSVGCIAGSAVALAIEKGEDYDLNATDAQEVAEDLMGLDEQAAQKLFYGYWPDMDGMTATPSEAAMALRSIAAGEWVFDGTQKWVYAKWVYADV